MLNDNTQSVKLRPYKLELIEPSYSSNLVELIMELDHLRTRRLSGTTPPQIFFQLKSLFHTLESIGSANIEGNRTTVAEFIETKLDKTPTQDEQILEIQNMENALEFIDKTIKETSINRMFLSELHKLVVGGLSNTGEGDPTPGEYRKTNVIIAGAVHVPPDYITVNDYMEELFDFINNEDPPKYDLLKTAIVHHRFVWIHPFRNGNGRTVRLLTYAMLVKQGFNIDVGRIVNPTAIFCSNRDKYYKTLSLADSGEREDILSWMEYVLSGLKIEIDKIDKLLDYNFLSKNILLPAIESSHERQIITSNEKSILKLLVEKRKIKAVDIKSLTEKEFAGDRTKSLSFQVKISKVIKGLKDKNMIEPEKKGSRIYVLNFYNNKILRDIVQQLDKHCFLPLKDCK